MPVFSAPPAGLHSPWAPGNGPAPRGTALMLQARLCQFAACDPKALPPSWRHPGAGGSASGLSGGRLLHPAGAGGLSGRTALWFRSPGHPGRRLRRGILQRPGGSRAARRCPVRPGHLQRRCAFGRREVQIRHLALRHRCPSPLSTGKPGPDLEHVCPHGTRGISPGVGPRRASTSRFWLRKITCWS